MRTIARSSSATGANVTAVPRSGDARKRGRADFKTIVAAVRTLVFFAAVLAALGGTAYAAVHVMGGAEPDVAAIRAKRAKAQAAYERKQRALRRRQAAGGAVAPNRSRKRRNWAAAADVLCTNTYNEALELVSISAVSTPDEILDLLDQALRINGKFISRLERLGPAPNRRLSDQLLRELKSGQAIDAAAIRRLRQRWVPAELQANFESSRRRNESLRRLALRLEAYECARAFDPAGGL